MKTKRINCFILFLLIFPICYGQNNGSTNQRIEKILSSLTLDEKVSLCSGGRIPGDRPCFKGIERLGIPNVREVDGPRGASVGSGTTAFPSGVLLGATWNPTIIEQAGKVMGEESRALGYRVLLAPAINILRDPLNGRFFEYYTEDPYLNGAIAVGLIKGIQSEGVAACAKHYVCNNRENNRNYYMSILDDRTLHEIYLPGFKAAVQDGDVYTIMTSANGVNYEYVSDSRKLLTDILKDKWGFKGLVLTDWLQTRSTEKAAFAGLDISMPGGDECGFGNSLLKAVKSGKVSEDVINDKVRRILGIYDKVGALDNSDFKKGAQLNTNAHQEIAKNVAEDGIVLLKNENHTLPLDASKVKNILVTGPNADKRFCIIGMGGSSWVESPYEVTVLNGLKKLIGDSKVTYISSDNLGGFKVIPQNVLEPINGVGGFNGRYYVKGKSEPILNRVDKTVDFMWEMNAPDKSIKVEDFREARFDAKIMPPVSGKYTFRFIVGGGSALVYNNEWAGAPVAIVDPKRGLSPVTASIDLKKGVPYHLCIIYSKGIGDAAIRVEWETPQSELSKKQLVKIDKAAKKADAVIYVGGIDNSLDTEGRDRVSLTFPQAQESLINHLARYNKNINVVLINGSPLEIGGWLPNVRSVSESWYPGMEGGTAVANVLFGKVNPSGRLPFTWPKKLADVPCYKLAYQDNDNVIYKDSLMVGYRYYDTKNVEPQFPFGFGLSYSKFVYSNLKVENIGDNQVKGSVTLTNDSKVDGAEVVQVYVKPVNPSVERPIHELKYFKKMFVKAGESVNVNFILKQNAFSYYDIHTADWKVDKCNYEIEIGNNSQNIVARASVSL